MYESLSFLSWSVVLALIVFGRKSRVPSLAPYLMLIAVALVALASSPLMPKDATPLVPALQSYWLWLHVSVTLLGEAFFAVAFVASLLFLGAGSEEKKERLDALAYRAVAVGFPLFTLGGLVFGMVWAYRAWGRYWGWDPKEVWSLITWFVFALYLHTRIVMGWKGKRSALDRHRRLPGRPVHLFRRQLHPGRTPQLRVTEDSSMKRIPPVILAASGSSWPP